MASRLAQRLIRDSQVHSQKPRPETIVVGFCLLRGWTLLVTKSKDNMRWSWHNRLPHIVCEASTKYSSLYSTRISRISLHLLAAWGSPGLFCMQLYSQLPAVPRRTNKERPLPLLSRAVVQPGSLESPLTLCMKQKPAFGVRFGIPSKVVAAFRLLRSVVHIS